MLNSKTVLYILDFLSNNNGKYVHFGSLDTIPASARVVIVPSVFWDKFGSKESLPSIPLQNLAGVPLLFGDARQEKDTQGRIILYADLVASSFFLLSRYEEFTRKDIRDIHGRFPGKESLIVKSGCALRPLVDEYGRYLRNLLREAGVNIPEEKRGFQKIYLTHDVDVPFQYLTLKSVVKQWIKNLIRYKNGTRYDNRPLHKYFHPEEGNVYTFPTLIKLDSEFKSAFSQCDVESVYFIITAGSRVNPGYYNMSEKRTVELLKYLQESGARLGLHISYEAGGNSFLIKREAENLRKNSSFELCNHDNKFYSRHHYLRWHEPEDYKDMVRAGITDDFTLGYADYCGFRVGTCRPYKFIDPETTEVTDLTIHSLTIMECTLDRPQYMGLSYEDAFEYAKKMIAAVHEYNGELVLLWHNTNPENNWYYPLYEAVLKEICISFNFQKIL
ncbi:MAG: polysaccharide deacetylase family protein [Spirochaetia bacterium]|nr:polysaccharide deacetylase family protein [Spirochaetia bacterium]